MKPLILRPADTWLGSVDVFTRRCDEASGENKCSGETNGNRGGNVKTHGARGVKPLVHSLIGANWPQHCSLLFPPIGGLVFEWARQNQPTAGPCVGNLMGMITPQHLEILLPLASAWAAEQERIILQTGVGLTEAELADARRLGVVRPERVRLLRVAQIPTPTHPALATAAVATGLISSASAGLTVRYGIFIRADFWGLRPLVAHELVHTSQYERLGGFEAFLRPYLMECITPPGYPHGPIEQEAVTMSARLCA